MENNNNNIKNDGFDVLINKHKKSFVACIRNKHNVT